MMTTGKKPIVVKVGSNFYEHETRDAAIAEACRLAGEYSEEFVVYVPVAIVRPKNHVTVDLIPAAP